MISLKKILQDDDATGEALLRVVRLLLQGIQEHAIEGDADDLSGFRASIHRLVTALEDGLSASELLVQAGSVLQTLHDYNRRTARYLKRPAGEWQAVVTMLISVIGGTPGADEGTVNRLREISARVRAANLVDDVHKIRLQLSECLTQLQLDHRHVKDEEVRNASIQPAPVTDTIPGLLTRPQAEESLATAWQSDPPSYVAIMALDRLKIFNMRFGHSVGDEVVRFYADFLHEHLRDGDRIFRWSAGALLAILPRPNRLEIVRDEIARLMEVRCEHTVQTPSRTILLPIAARWTVFPSMAAPRLLIHKIDAFAENSAVSS